MVDGYVRIEWEEVAKHVPQHIWRRRRDHRQALQPGVVSVVHSTGMVLRTLITILSTVGFRDGVLLGVLLGLGWITRGNGGDDDTRMALCGQNDGVWANPGGTQEAKADSVLSLSRRWRVCQLQGYPGQAVSRTRCL